MGNAECILTIVIVSALTLGPSGAFAADSGQNAGVGGDGRFPMEWEAEGAVGSEPVLRGDVENRSDLRVGDVRLRIETLDGDGKVIGHASGWVSGDVPARGRAYFLVPITVPGAAYRVSVESYDPISVVAVGGERSPGSPSASPPMAPR